MKSKPVIRAERLSKALNFYSRPADLLYELVSGKPRHDVFWALRDLNLDVVEGDRIGIIGPNGAGKWTAAEKAYYGQSEPDLGHFGGQRQGIFDAVVDVVFEREGNRSGKYPI